MTTPDASLSSREQLRAEEGEAPDATSPAAVSPQGTSRVGRIWPILTLVGLFWGVTIGLTQLEMPMVVRFGSGLLLLLVLFVGFLVWWFRVRGLSKGERLLGFVGLLGSWLIFGFLNHPSFNHVSTLMGGLPWAVTFTAIWMWLMRSADDRLRRRGLLIGFMVVFGAFTLLRWKGLDGAQQGEVAWRWTPSAEELFLKERMEKAPAAGRELDAASEWVAGPEDWVQFRGPDRKGIAPPTGLADWTNSPPQLVWKTRVGPAWSSMIVVGDRLVTQEQRGDYEAVVCYDADSGKEVWEAELPGRFEESLSGPGPRATPTFADGAIYAYGATGQFCRIDAATGEVSWSRDLLHEVGAQVPQWGLSVSPLFVDRGIYLFMGGPEDYGVARYDPSSGMDIWRRPAGKISYSSPQYVELGGVPQVIFLDEVSIKSFRGSNILWELPHDGPFQAMLQPQQISETELLVQSDFGVMLLDVVQEGDDWKVSKRWSSNRLKPGFNDFVVHERHIYGLDDGILCCLQVEDGKRVWKRGRYGHGQLLLVPEPLPRLVVLGEQGEVTQVAASPDGLQEFGSFQAIDGKCWNHPVIHKNRLYVRNGVEMACFDLTP